MSSAYRGNIHVHSLTEDCDGTGFGEKRTELGVRGAVDVEFGATGDRGGPASKGADRRLSEDMAAAPIADDPATAFAYERPDDRTRFSN